MQEERTIRKICLIDSHISLAFAGLTADARVMIDRVRAECQYHRLNNEDPVTVEYITRYLGKRPKLRPIYIFRGRNFNNMFLQFEKNKSRYLEMPQKACEF